MKLTQKAPPRRRFKIEPFKHRMEVDKGYADETWAKLEAAIKEINNHKTSGLSFEELYRSAYNMVLHKFGDRLYSGLEQCLTTHLESIAEFIIATQGQEFVTTLERCWQDHLKSVQAIRDILMYMDRTYVQQMNKTPVNELAMQLWRDCVLRNPHILPRLMARLLYDVRRERGGEVIDRDLMRRVTKMFHDLGQNVYEQYFEQQLLESTADFYRQESQLFLSTSDCPDYLRKAEARLLEEEVRCATYLDASTLPKLTAVVDREMIRANLVQLVNMDTGFVSMVRDEVKHEDLRRMYTLFHRGEEGILYLKDVLGDYVCECGKHLVTEYDKDAMDENDKGGCNPAEFIQRLLNLKDKYNDIIATSFGNDRRFVTAVNQAFEHFININPRSPEYLSLYVDEKLRKGLKGVGEDDIDVVLDKIMTLFRFLQEKDVFEKYYKQHLSKRLLSGNSPSDDTERTLIVKLKTECGYQFTHKLESMFQDIVSSVDTMSTFKSFVEKSEHPLPIGLSVQVLTTGSWPTQPGAVCIMPEEARICCERFKEYYMSKHTGRRLTWHLNMGTALVHARFPGNAEVKQLSVSTYQMCILVLFNHSDCLSYREILQVETREKVEADRKPQIEAAIVRIMKSRRVLDHNNLVSEVEEEEEEGGGEQEEQEEENKNKKRRRKK